MAVTVNVVWSLPDALLAPMDLAPPDVFGGISTVVTILPVKNNTGYRQIYGRVRSESGPSHGNRSTWRAISGSHTKGRCDGESADQSTANLDVVST